MLLTRQGYKLELWWRQAAPQGEFWRIAAAVFLFNAGISVYLFLYNLFLLDLGLREQRIGVLVSAMALGSIVSTVPLGVLARRYGSRRTLIVTLLLFALGFGARAMLTSYAALLVCSFGSGTMFSGWVICLSPAVAGVVEERKRPFSFSILFAIAVATSAIGGLAGANMPRVWQWVGMHGAAMMISALTAKRMTLLMGSVLLALAAWPLAGLTGDVAPHRAATTYTFSPFLKRFVFASGCWGAAIGFFNPFVGVYFTRYVQVPLVRLGVIFAIAQVVQTIAVLGVPSLLRRAGLVTGIACAQVSAAVSLALLSMSHGTWAAAVFYCGFMASQHATEPGIQSLLMDRVGATERSGASALNFLVVSISQAGAATLGGIAFARFGYPAFLAAIAVAIAASAVIFSTLCASPDRHTPVPLPHTSVRAASVRGVQPELQQDTVSSR